MLVSLTIWLLMAGAAISAAQQFSFSAALAVWAALAALLCALGALLIYRQPLGVATTGGLCGSSVVHWGFRVGRGQLIPAAAISWLIWLVLGDALVTAIRFPEHALIIAAWTADLLGIFYCLGSLQINRGGARTPAVFSIVGLSLVVLTGVSAVLWFRVGTDGARAIALAVAGGPPFLIGGVYGIVALLSFFAQPRGRR